MWMTLLLEKEFQFSVVYRSTLTYLAVETEGVDPGSAEMDDIIRERTASTVAWLGRPFKSAVAILVSIVVFLMSIVVSTTPLAYGEEGKESATMIVLRSIALLLGTTGSLAFLTGNISWRRFKYTFTSVEGVLFVMYTLMYAVAGLAHDDADNSPIGRKLGTLYVSSGYLVWLSFESVKQISRILHVVITFSVASATVFGIYLTAFVWQDDSVLADLNGFGVAGTLTRYGIMRTCFGNLLFLMSGSIVMGVTTNWADNTHFVLVAGQVLRSEIIESMSSGNFVRAPRIS
jgi:hypothetical protein